MQASIRNYIRYREPEEETLKNMLSCIPSDVGFGVFRGAHLGFFAPAKRFLNPATWGTAIKQGGTERQTQTCRFQLKETTGGELRAYRASTGLL